MSGPESGTYDKIKNDWLKAGGVALRLYNIAHSGYPDFCLCHAHLRQPAFTEVKTVPTPGTSVGLSTHQQVLCSALMATGASVFMLVYCIRTRVWAALPLEDYFLPLPFAEIRRVSERLCPELFFQ